MKKLKDDKRIMYLTSLLSAIETQEGRRITAEERESVEKLLFSISPKFEATIKEFREYLDTTSSKE